MKKITIIILAHLILEKQDVSLSNHMDIINHTRLDIALKEYFNHVLLIEISRAKIHTIIKQNCVLINHVIAKPSQELKHGDHIKITLDSIDKMNLLSSPHKIVNQQYQANDNININLAYEDDQLMVINKSHGIAVHPGHGNYYNTLLNGLLDQYNYLVNIPRCGIVHRLDQDTSGLMLVAKTQAAFDHLTTQIKNKQIIRKYLAIINGTNIIDYGTIDKKIGRHLVAKTKMTTYENTDEIIHLKSNNHYHGVKYSNKNLNIKDAITHYKVITKYSQHSLIECTLETGRTHQIRVHLKSIGYPIIGDKVYGNHQTSSLDHQLINRQALHAYYISFIHPVNQEQISFNATMPYDMVAAIDKIYQL